MKNKLSLVASTLVLFQLSATSAMAQITNPILTPKLGRDPSAAASGATFSSYFITIWRALIMIGGLALLFNLVNGAIEWTIAGGEKGKIEHARQKMSQSLMGMIILVGSFAIITYISNLFGFNLLRATIPTPQ